MATPHEPRRSPFDTPQARAFREREEAYYLARKLEREAEAAAAEETKSEPAKRADRTLPTFICNHCDRHLALDHFPRREDAELDYRTDICVRCLRVNEIEFDLHHLGAELRNLAVEIWQAAANLSGGLDRRQLDSALERNRRRIGAKMPPKDDIEFVIRELVVHRFAIDVWGTVHTSPSPHHLNPPTKKAY